LGTCPQKGSAEPGSERDIPLTFGAVQFNPNDYLYGDEDGLILVNAPLTHISF